ncbi:GNAT family N-acetyltransferase [Mycobacterium sp. SMC-4]|uniref:GNAT family N-acetyltransferase n=1 Tax=Mycobacterium sp. SMC-4 TaxID=2857059 RepID=UPI003D05B2AB
MSTDKTGAPTEVSAESDRYTISVDGQRAGFTEFVDHDGQRIFPHTEVDDQFSGRGLGSILVQEALEDTRKAGKRIVPVCSMVEKFIDKHPEFKEITDPVTDEVKDLLAKH